MTNTQRTIVIGVDYSDHSIHAVDEALRAPAAQGARLVPVLVLPGSPATGSPDAEAMTAELVERSKDNLVQLLQARGAALGVGVGAIDPEVTFGQPAERLVAVAKTRNADLIVVGTHGREGLSHLLLGSVADEVMRKAHCSVLVARASDTEATVAIGRGARARGAAAGAAELARRDALEGDASPADTREETTGIVSEPHIDAGRVVLHVMDPASGQVFVCAFDDFTSSSIEPLEGDWVPAPSSDARARVARIAYDAARRERAAFAGLFEEIGRRQARAHAR